MWMLLPALSLAIVHIAGDNAGVVPDAAMQKGTGIFLTVALAYFILGAGLTGLAAWIGVRTGAELAIVVRRLYGVRGKRLFAVITLGISIPASALTGGYFAAWLVHDLTGLPQPAAAPLCLALFTLLALGYLPELLLIANYCSLLLVPALAILLVTAGGEQSSCDWQVAGIDWPLVMALFGYNAGGMRPALAAETAACLARRGGRAVWLTVAAKLVEGVLTITMAYIVLAAGATGPLALASVAESSFGPAGGMFFTGVLFFAFATTMVPAMVVNGRHVACCTGLGSWRGVVMAAVAVYLATFVAYDVLLQIMGWTAGATAVFIGYTAYTVHKKSGNQQ